VIDEATRDQVDRILSRHIGGKNAITTRQIASLVFDRANHATCFAVFESVDSLIKDLHRPYCSGSQGYFRAATAEELGQYHEALRERFKELWRRMRAVRQVYREVLADEQKQADLPLEPEPVFDEQHQGVLVEV